MQYLAYDKKNDVLYGDGEILIYPRGDVQSLDERNRIRGSLNTPKVTIFKETGFIGTYEKGKNLKTPIFHKDLVEYKKRFAVIELDEYYQSYYMEFVGRNKIIPKQYLTKGIEKDIIRIGNTNHKEIRKMLEEMSHE